MSSATSKLISLFMVHYSFMIYTSIDSVNFNNGNCNGKLICGEGIDGTCEYIFVSKGRRGVYDLRVMVDKYLEPIYEDIIDHIIYSFDIIDKI